MAITKFKTVCLCVLMVFVMSSTVCFSGEEASEREKIETKLANIESILGKMSETKLPAAGKTDEFGGINFGIGLGASYLDHSNIKEATIVGSQTRVINTNKKSADFILETHYLVDILKPKRTALKKVINSQIDTMINLLNSSDSADLNQIKNLTNDLCKSIQKNRYYTALDGDKIHSAIAKLYSVKDVEIGSATASLRSILSELKPAELENPTKFGIGPFCYMKMGGDNIISGFGLGIMFGFKSNLTDGRIFNIGVARGFQNNVNRISETFDPAKETDLTKMFKTQDVDTWSIVISTNL